MVGVSAGNSAAPGVYAQTKGTGPGLLAISGLATLADALFGTDLDGAATKWAGTYKEKAALSGHLAGEFEGDLKVTGTAEVGGALTVKSATASGTITASDVILSGADCAEQFDMADHVTAEPGTVLVIDMAGTLRPSAEPYDRKVAGVVSGAGDFRPGIVLDRRAETAGRGWARSTARWMRASAPSRWATC